MSDLIWIGNTLYPRWFVIGVVGLVFLTPFVIGALVSILRRKK